MELLVLAEMFLPRRLTPRVSYPQLSLEDDDTRGRVEMCLLPVTHAEEA